MPRLFVLIPILLGFTGVHMQHVWAGGESDLLQKQQQRIDTIAKIAPSVVCVMPAGGQGGGSGVLISADGYAISNYHVTSGSGNFMKCGLNDGRLYDAVIVGIDPTGDVALIRLLGRDDFPACTVGNSDHVRVGDEVMALGNPFLLAGDFSPTVTYGIVSGIRRYQYPANTFLEYTDCIQIDASINPGNSGGPLFDADGKWIGINGRASFEKRGRVNSGAAYAISVNQVMLFIDHLKSGRIVDHGRTEFTVRTVEDTVEVQEVSELSDLWRRGMRPGHELISFGGRSITSANDFKNVVGIYPEGIRVPLVFRDDDRIRKVTTRLSPVHAFNAAPPLPPGRQPPGQQPLDGEGDSDDEADASLLETTPKPPEQYKDLFVEREGFTNFYFNRVNTDRLLVPLQDAIRTMNTKASKIWKLQASVDINGQTRAGLLTISDSAAGLDFAGLAPALQEAADPKGDNETAELYGLLTGLLQWQRFAQNGAEGFSGVTYEGSELLQPEQSRREILKTTNGNVISRWAFDQKSPMPVGVEIIFDTGFDDARIRFDGWQTKATQPWPSRIGIVDHDTETVRWLTITSVQSDTSD